MVVLQTRGMRDVTRFLGVGVDRTNVVGPAVVQGVTGRKVGQHRIRIVRISGVSVESAKNGRRPHFCE
jgi:hypothetical protein